MLLVGGSWLIRDSGKRSDIDVIYLTWNIGKYLYLLRRRREIEKNLQIKYGIKVSFAPYLILSPTLPGNLFLAITLLRYPLTKPYARHILKFTLGRRDKRWLFLHFAFALLGLISAKNVRDCVKYCSMASENLLYIENSRIPNTWKDTILFGYTVALRYGLPNLSNLLLICNKCMNKGGEIAQFLDVDSFGVIDVVNEYMKLINIEDVKLLSRGFAEALRRIHEIVAKYVLKEDVKWRKCSLTIMLLIHPKILARIIRNRTAKMYALAIFNKCRQEIPVLSPLAHP